MILRLIKIYSYPFYSFLFVFDSIPMVYIDLLSIIIAKRVMR